MISSPRVDMHPRCQNENGESAKEKKRVEYYRFSIGTEASKFNSPLTGHPSMQSKALAYSCTSPEKSILALEYIVQGQLCNISTGTVTGTVISTVHEQ
ncbi:hypothetical protein E3N88_26030 [Mikania micrantha]|uniref:Uncharacterized protein n=1 Tax=Mikania micrantha TaxID=192012 RepID=A0A5N6N965_9ASTR|nr:hypothetical protein E3N88_26030 [Mikania micrantha]